MLIVFTFTKYQAKECLERCNTKDKLVVQA